MSLAQMKRVSNTRKAIIILSDGGDNHSRATESEIKKAVREADVQIYAVGIFDRNESPKRPPEERNGPFLVPALSAVPLGLPSNRGCFRVTICSGRGAQEDSSLRLPLEQFSPAGAEDKRSDVLSCLKRWASPGSRFAPLRPPGLGGHP